MLRDPSVARAKSCGSISRSSRIEYNAKLYDKRVIVGVEDGGARGWRGEEEGRLFMPAISQGFEFGESEIVLVSFLGCQTFAIKVNSQWGGAIWTRTTNKGKRVIKEIDPAILAPQLDR